MQKKGSIFIAVIAAMAMFAASACSGKEKNANNGADSLPEITEPVVTTEPYIPPVVIEVDNQEMAKGKLILVNREHQYIDGSNPNIVDIAPMKTDAYFLNNYEMRLDSEMIEQMNAMLNDFSARTGITDVMANSGYRSLEEQKELYYDDLAATGLNYSKLVAMPGYSEHHTGYAMDFAINDGGGYPALRNEGEYSWIYQNAASYGMILRYTESNQIFTGFSPESWHFRYLGVPNASIVYRMGISYEEYIDFIRDFTYDEPLEYKLSSSEFYKIYFVPADTEKSSTEIPLPFEAYESSDKDAFYISGNNVDGFIVTVKVSELSDDYNEMIFDMFKTPEQYEQEMAQAESGSDDEVSSDDDSSEEVYSE